MSKEEPAWKAELMSLLDEHFISSGEEIFDLVAPHILAAEQRGFQAGVNKTGDSVGKLREQLKTAEERGRQQALSAVKAEIEALGAGISDLKARPLWKSGYQGALGYLSVTLDSIMPNKP